MTGLAGVDAGIVALVFGAFLAGGIIKGLSGIGLPMVALPILSLGLSVPLAVALTMAPILVTNGWQAATNGRLLPVLRRFWPMQLALAVTLILATSLMSRLENGTLLVAAGAILVASTAVAMLAPRAQVPPRLERPVGVGVGILAGTIGGFSSLFGIPIIIFMSSLGLSRADYLSSISVVYFMAAVPYVGGLLWFGAVSPAAAAGSVLALVPSFLGMALAGRMTRDFDEGRFRRMLNWLLAGLGLMMMVRGIAYG